MNLEIDCKTLSTKVKLLSFFQKKIESIHDLNYDALYDALTYYKEPLIINLRNEHYFEDLVNLKETLLLIEENNSFVSILWSK